MARPAARAGSGGTPITRVDIVDLDAFRRDLKRMDSALAKELRRAHKKAADLQAKAAQGRAPRRVPRSTIKGKSTQRAARVEFTPGKRGDALAVLWGMKRRTGWYARPRYGGSAGRQHRPWVGNQWEVGARGGEPYDVGEPMNRAVDDVIELYGDEIEALAKRAAFPN